MSRIVFIAALLVFCYSPARGEEESDWLRPYGIERRIPWTTSRVVGSPEPPLPYRIARAYPQLTIKQPLSADVQPGSDWIWVVQHLGFWSGPGRISRFRDQPTTKDSEVEILLDLDHIAYSLAFHPKFAENHYVYIGCNGPVTAKEKQTRVLRYTFDEQTQRLDPSSQTVIIEWPSDGHNGGALAFGPDGYLYVTAGDGTSDSDRNQTGQTLDDLPGACLRIDVDHPAQGLAYSVPRDNPFVDHKDARPEIWAYGLRNPWRMAFDAKAGHLWIGNNGQDLWEQVYFVRKGDNFGWSRFEGGSLFLPERKLGPTAHAKPAADHHHNEARSLTGGVVYHGKKLPALRGAYVYGDFSTGRIWGIKHDGTKVVWQQELVDTPLALTGFGLDKQGELLVIDHAGGFYHLEATPPQSAPSNFPRKLSETGLFTAVKGHVVDPALIPYSVNAPLWSDGAFKERFIALPGDSQIEFGTSRGWNCPEGTVLVKTFALERKAGDAASRQRIETRLMTKQQNEWVGYTYLWNEEQTEALLVGKEGADREFVMEDLDGKQRTLKWHYPSRAECMVCHSRASNFVLGLCEMQMNKEHHYGRVRDNQLRTLSHLGVLKVNIGEHENVWRERVKRWQGAILSLLNRVTNSLPTNRWNEAVWRSLRSPRLPLLTAQPRAVVWLADKGSSRALTTLKQKVPTTSLLPRRPGEYRRLVDPADETQPLAARAKSYLHSNCATCHVEAGGGNAQMELEFNTPLEKMRILDTRPQHHTFDLAEPRLIAPGEPERSVILERLRRRGAGQMPPLATTEVDTQAVELMRAWIKSLDK